MQRMCRRIQFFVSMFFVVGSCRCSAVGQGVSVVVKSSLERVLKDEVNVSGLEEAVLFCAKGEYESFQVIVANASNSSVEDIDLQQGQWKYEGQKPAGVPVLRMFREHYVEVKQSSGQHWKNMKGRLRKGMYPDALIPFVNPYTGKRITKAKYLASGQNIKPGNSQGYWTDIRIDRNVKAGTYTNKITILSTGKDIAFVPVKVVVWDFELPKTHKLKTYFHAIRDLSTYHRVHRDSPEYKTIVRGYLLMLHDHGIYLQFWKGPKVNRKTGEVTFTPEYVRELKAYCEEMHPSITRVTLLWYPFAKDPAKRARYLSDWEFFLKQNPWVPEPVVYVDCPNSKKDYLKLVEYGTALDAYAPDIKLLVTVQVNPHKPDYPSLEGIVDIWTVPWSRANPKDIKTRQKAGDEVWSYVALTGEGIPNWLIDFPLLDYRVPAWFSWSLTLKGVLYWQTMAWSKKDVKIAPWVDCQTYSKGGKIWNGEGSLVYPGQAAGIDGPIASMRLKVFRDSIEDFDYFSILSELVGRGETDKIVKNVASSFKIYNKDPNSYFQGRRLIAEKILDGKK